jgi:hypothetical protein
MKRTAAIMLSLILLWIPAMADVQAGRDSAPSRCGCCAPAAGCCCVEASTPEPDRAPAMPVSVGAAIDFSAVISRPVAWVLPSCASAILSSGENFSSSLTVPLFQRDCALLI